MKKKRQWFMCLGMIGVFTASVILSVFGQRKVKAQLNTENAGKITSSWADEKHIFSSFDDEKALSVDASYGFKMRCFALTLKYSESAITPSISKITAVIILSITENL